MSTENTEEPRALEPFDKNELALQMKTDPAIVAAAEAAKQRIQCAYIMAHQNPRNLESARQRMLASCRRPRFAMVAEYSKPVSSDRSKDITGPSIRFVEMCIREWGNCISDVLVEYEDAHIRRVKVIICDFQTNSTFTKAITIRKEVERRSSKGRTVISERKNSYGDTVYTVVATDDELLNKESALISKAIRTEGLRIIPGDFVDECLETCKQVLEGEVKDDIVEQRRKILDAFSKLGVSVEQIEEYLDCKVDSASPAQVIKLRKIWAAIDGEGVTWGDFMTKKREGREDIKDAPDGKKADADKKKAEKKKAAADKKKKAATTAPPEEKKDPKEDTKKAPEEDKEEEDEDNESEGAKERLEQLCLDNDVTQTERLILLKMKYAKRLSTHGIR